MRTYFRAINETSGTVLCERLEAASTMSEQSRGLLGRDGLASDEGLLFKGISFKLFPWLHMFFMRFTIDIVFLNRRDVVMKINQELKPWRVSSFVIGARSALELAAGA